MNITEGTLLNGKIRYRQFTTGHRSGFEPVLLAAAIPAKPGDAVLEAGTGAGAALLCLAHRVPGLTGLGLEIDPALTALANENFTLNGLKTLSAMTRDAADPPAETFDHIFANPPWHAEASTTSPDLARARAHHAPATCLDTWVTALSARLKPRGTLTLILPAPALTGAIIALNEQDLGGQTLFPLWPRAAQAAKLFIIAARKGAKSPVKILPGLILHDEAGITAQANSILRDGDAISV